MIKRILVALSGTPFTPSAVRYAVELAQAHEAEVTGVTLVDIERLQHVGPVPLGGGSSAHELAEHRVHVTEERIEEQIAAFESACREAGTIHSVVRETGDAMEQLIARWRYHDLTIFGLRGLFEYGVVHNPDDQIIKVVSCGVRPILAVSEQYHAIRRALIAFNGSMESAKAMKRFVQARLWPDTQIKIACFGFKNEEAEPLLADAVAYCRSHGFEAQAESLKGSPERGLLEHVSEWSADILVMGATTRSKIAKLLLGDTVLHAIRQAEVPLFLSQ